VRSHLYITELVCNSLSETRQRMREFVGDHVNDHNRKRHASVRLSACEVVVQKQMRIRGYWVIVLGWRHGLGLGPKHCFTEQIDE
jgi:hypothetical protein